MLWEGWRIGFENLPAMEAMFITRLGESEVVPLRRREWSPTVAGCGVSEMGSDGMGVKLVL